jgi:hypothetical protein
MSLDVARYARFQYGISIGTDPGSYALDVNGQFRVTDGYGQISMSNQYDGVNNNTGASNASFVEMKPLTGGTMTLAVTGTTVSSTGYATAKGTWISTGNGTSNIIFVPAVPGLVTAVARNGTTGSYKADFLLLTAVSTPTGSNTITSGTAAYTITATASGILLSNSTAGAVTFTYNVTFYPC